MNDTTEIERLRASWAARQSRAEVLARPESAFLARVITTVAAAGTFFKAQPQIVTGGECEGCSGAFLDQTVAEILVYNLGPGTLTTGEKVVVSWVRDRWVARRKSTGGGPDPAVCTCWTAGTLPTTLYWTMHTQLTSFDLSTTTDLGTTTGTAAYTASTTVGGASCPTFNGWLGEFSWYAPALDEAGGPGGGAGEGETTITPVLIPHCAEGFFAPDDALYPGCTSSNCRWINITCDPTYILDVKIIGSEVITCSGSPAATNCYYHSIFIPAAMTYTCTPSFLWRCNILGLSPMLVPPFGLINFDLQITL